MDGLANLAALEALEEAEIAHNNNIPRLRFQPRINPFENLNDQLFMRTYRLSKELVTNVINLVSPFMAAPSRTSALDIQTKVLVALNFFGYGSYQFDVGQNIHAAVSQSSVSRAVAEISDIFNNPEILRNFIIFPQNVEEMQSSRQRFFEKHRFPTAIGCIDCTYVAIFPPPKNDPVYPEHIYVNRKGYHSINTQIICDSELKIINVNARYPGSSHDSFIWNNSNVKQHMEQINQGQHSFTLLGDSGYPLRSYLLTPFNDAIPGTPQDRYNIAHRRSRSIVERCIGVLKTRFRCLLKHRVLHYAPSRASKIINTCCCLHNMCMDANLPNLDPEEADMDYGIFDQDHPDPAPRNQLNEGHRQRDIIVRNHFQ